MWPLRANYIFRGALYPTLYLFFFFFNCKPKRINNSLQWGHLIGETKQGRSMTSKSANGIKGRCCVIPEVH